MGSRTLRCIHAFLGLFLIAAGTFKLYDFALANQVDDLSSLLFPVLAEIEFLAGIWLLLGSQMEQTRPWVIAFFSGLLVSSFYHVVSGRCSCGCFGSIAVNPWFSLSFDVIAVTILLVWRPTEGHVDMKVGSPQIAALTLTALCVGIAGISEQGLVAIDGTATWNKQPLADSPLVFRGNWVDLQVTTDHEGHFHLPLVRPGQYVVTAVTSGSLSDPKLNSSAPYLLQKKASKMNPLKSYGNSSSQRGRDLRKHSRAPAQQQSNEKTLVLEFDECLANALVLGFTQN